MANYRMNKIAIGSNTYECAEWYGSCSTAANTQNKDASITGFLSAQLVTGCRVTVYFTYAQDYNGTPYLRCDGTTRYPIKYNFDTYAGKGAWKAGDIVTFTLRESAWYMDRRDFLTLADLPVWDGSVT